MGCPAPTICTVERSGAGCVLNTPPRTDPYTGHDGIPVAAPWMATMAPPRARKDRKEGRREGGNKSPAECRRRRRV